jgi:hypothetical protein
MARRRRRGMKKLKTDGRAESLIKPIIVMACFIGISALLISLMQATFDEGATGGEEIPEPVGVLGYSYTYHYLPDHQSVTWANNSGATFDESKVIKFYNDTTGYWTGGDKDLWVYIIRNNTVDGSGDLDKYTDFIYVSRHYGLFGWGRETASISYSDIESNAKVNSTGHYTSWTFFTVGSQTLTVVIGTLETQAAGFHTALYDDCTFDISIVVTTPPTTPTVGTGFDIFGFILQMATASLPGQHWIINAIVFSAFWACMLIVGFTIVGRIIGMIFGGPP